MVKPQTYYELYCDRCRKQLADGEVAAYNSESDLMFVAGESEWKTIDGKHYCPDCYKVDEETDEYVPKKGECQMNDQITIQKEKILNAYNQASGEQKELLESLFGKDMLHPKNIRQKVKTFEDACIELGEHHAFVAAFRIAEANGAFGSDAIAYLKLRIITAALNEGWEPVFDTKERRYYPWFYVYSKDKYYNLSDKKRKDGCVVYRPCYNAYAFGGVSHAFAFYDSALVNASIGSRFAFKTQELAEYCGRQFIDIWQDYLFA